MHAWQYDMKMNMKSKVTSLLISARERKDVSAVNKICVTEKKMREGHEKRPTTGSVGLQ